MAAIFILAIKATPVSVFENKPNITVHIIQTTSEFTEWIPKRLSKRCTTDKK